MAHGFVRSLVPALVLIPALAAATQDRSQRAAEERALIEGAVGDPLSQRAAEAFNKRDWQEAERAYAALVERDPADERAWLRLGTALHAQQKLDAALRAYEHALDFPSAAYNAACIHALRGATDLALDRLRSAVEVGFLDFEHARRDPDLSNLHEDPAFAAVLAAMERRMKTPLPEAVLGQAAPDFELTDVDGRRHRLESYRGRIVVLEWTSHTCPTVARYHESARLPASVAGVTGDDLVWLAIDSGAECDEWVDAIREWRSTVGHRRPYLLDPSGATGHRYGAQATPQIFVIDGSGVLRYSGTVDDEGATIDYVAATVAALREGRDPAPTSTELRGCTIKYASVLPGFVAADVWQCPPCGLPCDRIVFATPGRCPQCRMVLAARVRRNVQTAAKPHAQPLFDAARIAARAGEAQPCLASLRAALVAGFATPSRVLSDDAFAPLLAVPEPRAALRELLAEFASESTATIVRSTEPGNRLRLELTIHEAAGTPVVDARVDLYQTDAAGIYDPVHGSENPRLFASLVSDRDGRLVIDTIVPAGYPDADVSPHVHYVVETAGGTRDSGEIVRRVTVRSQSCPGRFVGPSGQETSR